MGFKQYCVVQERVEEGNGGSRVQQSLQHVLESAPHVRKVLLTYRHRSHDRVCQWKDCKIPRESHSVFFHSPLQANDEPSNHSRELGKTLSTIIGAVGENPLKELVMEPWHLHWYNKFLLETKILDEYSAAMPETGVFAANLRKLRLGFHGFLTGGKGEAAAVAQFLGQAHNLEYLFLEGLRYNLYTDASIPRAFEGSLGRCAFPKLRVLVLDDFRMEGEELMPFLKGIPMLKELVLERGELVGGYWKDLIDNIKTTTKLDCLHVNLLSKGFEEADEEWHVWNVLGGYVDFPQDVAQDFLHGGPNPFCKEEMALGKGAKWVDEKDFRPSIALRYYELYL